MQTWEYLSIIMDEGFGGNACNDQFDKVGAVGWELVSVAPPTEETFGVAFFKRPLQDDNDAHD